MMHKNPFDKQFELATKNRYNRATSIITSTSPLNTPSIPLTDGSNAFATDLLEPPTAILPLTSLVVSQSSQPQPSTTIPDNFALDIDANHTELSRRSNFVSVICSSLPSSGIQTEKKSSPTNENAELKQATNEWTLKLAGLVVQGNSNSSNDLNLVIPSNEIVARDNKLNLDSQSNNSNASQICVGENKLGKQVTLVVTLPDDESSESFTDWSTLNDSFIKICPKLDAGSQINFEKMSNSTSKLALPKRKEKSVEELLRKIEQTEAALPPKAKPGRKSKTASMEEDMRESKRRSLERNRAAAMRCRLKKKKEIDELKVMLDKFEKENNNLKLIIESLCKEVCKLKSQLLNFQES